MPDRGRSNPAGASRLFALIAVTMTLVFVALAFGAASYSSTADRLRPRSGSRRNSGPLDGLTPGGARLPDPDYPKVSSLKPQVSSGPQISLIS